MTYLPTIRCVMVAVCLAGCTAMTHAQQTLEPVPTGTVDDLQSFHPEPPAIPVDSYEQVDQGSPMQPQSGCRTFGGPSGPCNAFPYGAPLVGYEHAFTCYPHDYCHRHCDWKSRAQCSHWGYPEYFCEPPYGSKTRAYFHTQVRNGLSRQLALYNYDFFPIDTGRGGELKPRGYHEVGKVAHIAEMLQDPYSVLTIEPTGDAAIDEQRRAQVFEHLSKLGAPIALEQIVTAKPVAIGRSGIESVEVFNNQLEYVRAGTAGLTGEDDYTGVSVVPGLSGGQGGY